MTTRCEAVVQQTFAALDGLRAVSDLELADRAGRLKESGGVSDDASTAHALALVSESYRRVAGADIDEHLTYAGAAMALGMAAELPRDGRIEVALLFPAFVRSLEQKGSHVCDLDKSSVAAAADLAAAVFEPLKVRTAVVSDELSVADKVRAYGVDVTFGLLSTFAVDYLRDGLQHHAHDLSGQRLHALVVAELDVIAGLGARSAHLLGAEWEQNPPEPPPTLAKLVERMRVGSRHEVLIDEQGIRLTARGMRAADKAIGRRALLDPTDPLSLANVLSAVAVKHDARDSLQRPLTSVHNAGFLNRYDTMVGLVAHPVETAPILRKHYRLDVATTGDERPSGLLPHVPTTILPTSRDLHAAVDRLDAEHTAGGTPLVVIAPTMVGAALRKLVRARRLGEDPRPADVVSVGYGRTAINRAIRNDLVAQAAAGSGRVLLAADSEPCTHITDRKLLGSLRRELTFDGSDSTDLTAAIAAAQENIEQITAAQQTRGLALDHFVETHRRAFEEFRRSVFEAAGAERFMAGAARAASREEQYRRRCEELGDALTEALRRRIVLLMLDDARHLYLCELDAVMSHFELLVEGEGVSWYGDVAAAAYERAMDSVAENSFEHFLTVPVDVRPESD